jgi:RND family efflux transporter MFP subunit
MKETESYQSTEDPRSGDEAPHLNQDLWQGLTEAETDEEFCGSWLGLQSGMIGDVYSGMVVLGPADEGPYVPAAFWPEETQEIANLARVTERCLKERTGVVLREDRAEGGSSGASDRLLVAYPVRVAGKFLGAAALEIAPRAHKALQHVMRQLQWGVAWLENRLMQNKAESEADGQEGMSTALDLAAGILQEKRFRAAATAFATILATRFGCDRVSIGFLKGKHVKVHALSHSAQFKKQMNLIRAIGAAMDESVDQSAALVYPNPEGNEVLRAHAELVQQRGDGAVCTIPFLDSDEKGYGALTLERSADRPFGPREVELFESVAALAAPILNEKRENDQLLIRKIGTSLKAQIQKLTGPRHMAFKLITGAVLLTVVLLAVVRMEYRVSAKTTIEGQVQRAVVAPFDGYIVEASIRAGDVVKKGQVMCSMDERDLHLELVKWESQRAQYERQHREAMATRNRASMRIVGEQVNQAAAQVALLNEQISRAKITAPFEGVVVTGDLSQLLGSPVERGKLLFEVAPLENYRVRIQVNEQDIAWIKVGQKGHMMLNSLPELKFPVTVAKITPVSTAIEGSSYFLVEATVQEVSERLRPGMEGVSKIEIGKRSLFWILLHDLIDWIRLRLWSWLP